MKVTVEREVTEATGTELLAAYDVAIDAVKADLRTELLRRLDPPKKPSTRLEPFGGTSRAKKGA